MIRRTLLGLAWILTFAGMSRLRWDQIVLIEQRRIDRDAEGLANLGHDIGDGTAEDGLVLFKLIEAFAGFALDGLTAILIPIRLDVVIDQIFDAIAVLEEGGLAFVLGLSRAPGSHLALDGQAALGDLCFQGEGQADRPRQATVGERYGRWVCAGFSL